MIYPISFSVPAEKIVSQVPAKEKMFAHIIPGNVRTYVFDSEEEYYQDYKASVFGYTWRKLGFDCMRHYEILANGCIPYFPDLASFPKTIMTNFPRELVLKAMKEISVNTRFNDSEDQNLPLIQSYTQQLLDYTRNHLTTEHTAKYILEKINKNHVKSVLVLSDDSGPDYLRCLTLHGFKRLLGSACHEFPCVSHLYTDFPESQTQKLYGKGFTYSRLLDKSAFRNSSLDATIEEHIRNHSFDLVMYGSVHRGLPFLDLVRETYTPSEIIGLCGEDHPNEVCPFRTDCPFEHMFIRELI